MLYDPKRGEPEMAEKRKKGTRIIRQKPDRRANRTILIRSLFLMVLRAQYELAYDLESIEQNLTDSGAMVKPQNGQIIYVDLSEPDSVTYFQQEEEATGVEGAVESMHSIFTEIVEYFS